MGIDKSEIKMGTAHDIGALVDDMLEAANRDVFRSDGALTALSIAAKGLESIFVHVNKDVDDGKYDLEVAKTVKTYIQRCLGSVTSLLTNAEIQKIRSQGKIEAFQAAVKATKLVYDQEKAKRDALLRASDESSLLEDGARHAPSARPSGMRPDDPLLLRRARGGARGRKQTDDIDDNIVDKPATQQNTSATNS